MDCNYWNWHGDLGCISLTQGDESGSMHTTMTWDHFPKGMVS